MPSAEGSEPSGITWPCGVNAPGKPRSLNECSTVLPRHDDECRYTTCSDGPDAGGDGVLGGDHGQAGGVSPQEQRHLILDAPGCEGARRLGLTPSPVDRGVCELDVKAAFGSEWIKIGNAKIHANRVIAMRDAK